VILFDAIQEMVVGMRQTLVPEPTSPAEALNTFRQILEHVKVQNAEGAMETIQRHLAEIWQRFEVALSKLENESDSES
jgi:DNA-binding FadR family transcriptional regulator